MSTRPVEGSEQAANEVVLPHLVPVAASRAGVGAARASKGHAVKLLHYAVAMALAASATALNFTLAHALRGPTLLLPVTAAALAALYGGVGPGLFAAALSVAGHDYFLIEPRYALLIAHRGDAYRLALLAGVASLVAAVSGSLRRAVWRAQEERARAEESAESLAVSHALVTALAAAHTQEDVTRAIFENGFEALGARTMLISRLVEPDQLTIVRTFGFPREAAGRWNRFSVTASVPFAEAVQTGRSIWIASREELASRYPAIVETARTADAQAWACVPIASEGRIIGSFFIGFAEARMFEDSDRRFLESLAATCGQALERARLFEAERSARLRAETAEDEAKRIGDLQERLVAVVSHDLRNPLAAITSGINLLPKMGDLDERQVAVHASIRKVAARMEGLIHDLLDFSRARRRFEMPTSSEPTDMEDIARRAVGEIRIANPAADVLLVTEGEQRGVWDPARMEQALSNLISNAIQHGGGSRVWLRSIGSPGKLVIEVENQGPTIPTERLAVLFEPFHQGKGDQPGHLGLGLFIVREIVSAHGGTLVATSTPAGVTTLRVELPRQITSRV